MRCLKSERDDDLRYNLEMIHGIQPQNMLLCGLQLYEGRKILLIRELHEGTSQCALIKTCDNSWLVGPAVRVQTVVKVDILCKAFNGSRNSHTGTEVK